MTNKETNKLIVLLLLIVFTIACASKKKLSQEDSVKVDQNYENFKNQLNNLED